MSGHWKQSVIERRPYREVRLCFFGKCSEFTVSFIYTLALEMARTSRGSDDHVKWRSCLLIFNGRIREKIQHPNDFPPENHIHRLALKLCSKNVERFTFLLVPSDRKTIQKVRSLLVRNRTHAVNLANLGVSDVWKRTR